MKNYFTLTLCLLISIMSTAQDFFSDKLINELKSETKSFVSLSEEEQLDYLEDICDRLSCKNEDDAAEKVSAFVVLVFFSSNDLVQNHLLSTIRCNVYAQDKVRMKPESFLYMKYPLNELSDMNVKDVLALFDELCLCARLEESNLPLIDEYCSKEALEYRNGLLSLEAGNQ